ncbi:HAMP domain-containing histidine kinase [Luteolibacter ambystomatis]|uniref:histidine kinase n=1 Tax=Luteolibacter ambystomatis TaxID=2824561 RepID=A0A975G7H7_9BACT|nr:HAMP domain-containing sensor histidine kinase [Luteolibacter ambystomatis]QUE49720.1 HAMP domain-containing histidine kinase [Luteolibacter ambystomatis]
MKVRFPLLAALVLVPMVLLSVLAWRGAHARRVELIHEQGEEARRLALACALEIRKEMDLTAISIPNYPDPPIPQADDTWSRKLEAAATAEELRKLRDDPAAGLTTSGLPVRALAAFRILEITEAAAPGVTRTDQTMSPDAKEFERLVTHEAPSVMTGLLLEQAANEPIGPDALAWPSRQSLREWAAALPPDARQWVGTSWLDNGKHLTVPPDWMAKLPALVKTPGWSARAEIVGVDGYPYHNKPTAEQEVSGYPGLSIQIMPPKAGVVEAGLAAQERLSLVMVVASAVTALGGMALLHRTLARERRLNELKSHFVASVSHELRAPVGSIRLMADALDAGKVAPETAAEFHRLISREGKRLSHLIENVLDFARIEQGRKRWHFEPTDMVSLVADTMKVMEPPAAEKRIALGFIHGVFTAEPEVDGAALQQALINLLDNAIKFSPPDSGIEVILASDDRCWRLAVRDHGPGIPRSEHARIFERFYRPGDELRRETQGTGIGLSLVKAIAEAHGGKVELDSRPNSGSTFTLVIPLHAPAGH